MRAPSLAVLVFAFFAAACSSTSEPPGTPPGEAKVASKATISASPNPVPGGAGWGTTTITWDTGDGSWCQVYLYVKDRDEVLFVEGASGTKQATWISIGPEYEFRLYANKDHKTLLASVTVTRSQN